MRKLYLALVWLLLFPVLSFSGTVRTGTATQANAKKALWPGGTSFIDTGTDLSAYAGSDSAGTHKYEFRLVDSSSKVARGFVGASGSGETTGANVCLKSRVLDDSESEWDPAAGTPSCTQDETGVDGASNKAWTITDDDGSSREGIVQELDISPDTQSYTASIFVKKTTGALSNYPGMGIIAGAANGHVTIDTTNGTITDRTGRIPDASGIVDTGDGFWRVWAAKANDSGTLGYILIVPAANTDGSGTWNVATTGSAVFDCAMSESNKTSPSAYIDNATGVLGADVGSDSDCSGGTLTTGAGWVHDAGNNEYDATASSGDLTDAGILTANKSYRLKIVYANDVGGSFTPKLGGTSGTAIDTDGTYYQYIIAGGTDLVFDATGLTGSIQSYEVKERGAVSYTECSSNGVHILSTKTGSTQDWASVETGFDYDDSSGYTYQILVSGAAESW